MTSVISLVGLWAHISCVLWLSSKWIISLKNSFQNECRRGSWAPEYTHLESILDVPSGNSCEFHSRWFVLRSLPKDGVQFPPLGLTSNSLYSLDWSWTSDPPASALLGLQVHTTVPSLYDSEDRTQGLSKSAPSLPKTRVLISFFPSFHFP